MILSKTGIKKALISLRGCAGWSAPLLFVNRIEGKSSCTLSREKLILLHADNKGTDQSAHLPSSTRAFVIRSLEHNLCKEMHAKTRAKCFSSQGVGVVDDIFYTQARHIFGVQHFLGCLGKMNILGLHCCKQRFQLRCKFGYSCYCK